MENYAIEMKHIDISFGDFRANKDVSLALKQGEILALIGENGAGKSTLMKILYGLYRRDAGEIFVNGKKMPSSYSPQAMIDLGVSMVPQQLMQVDAFSVAENIILGMERNAGRVMCNIKKILPLMEELCNKYGIHVPLEANIAGLPLGVKQKIEILKALYRGGKVIILDEPTTVLTPQEADELFSLLKRLKAQGLSVIIIAHKLQEVLAVSDRIAIMRLGEKVAEVETAATNAKELAAMMVGRTVETVQVSVNTDKIAPSIVMKGLTTQEEPDRCALKNLNLELYPGRVVGIAGINGNGQAELVEVLAGIRRLTGGSLQFDATTITDNRPDVMQKLGIGIIPEERREEGLVLDLTIRENIILGERKSEKLSHNGVFNKKKVNAYVEKLIADFDVRPNRGDAVVRFVSGGNQQKVVLARELSRDNLELVIAAQPVRGLDIGAIAFTHETLLKFRNQGKAVLLISADLDEIRELSDYIAVLSDGEIVSFGPANELTNEQIGLLMGGEKILAEVGA